MPTDLQTTNMEKVPGRLDSQSDWAYASHDEDARFPSDWYRAMLASVATLAGDQEVIHVQPIPTVPPGDQDSFEVSAGIFTHRRYIEVTARKAGRADTVEWSACARSLSEVAAVGVTAQPTNDLWPNLQQATVRFEDGAEVPLTAHRWSGNDLSALIKALLDRLDK